MKHRNRWKFLFAFLLVFCSTLWIITNSLMDFETSHNSSGSFVDAVVPDEYQEFEIMELIVRKIAHVIEYSFLGASVMIMTLYVRRHYAKFFFGFACFYVLAIAVTDEHIQSFSDRTSSTGDIILDFCGALIGFLAGWLIIKVYTALIQRFKRRSNRRQMNGGK